MPASLRFGLISLSAGLALQVQAAPTLLENVNGYTLSGDKIIRFSGMVFDQGTKIAGGSDFPVESNNPFFGLYAAVTRKDHHGQPAGGWHPEQAMTLPEAFRAFTLDAAYAQHQEQTTGSLEPGKWADFIVLDRDLFKVAPADIWKIKVKQTWVGGKQVFKSN